MLDEQTTIGYKRILRLPTVLSDKIRINILDAKACPLISNVEVYHAPKIVTEPVITRDKHGLVTISIPDKELEIKYSIDGGEPDKVYMGPIQTKGKTVVKADRIDG